MACQWTGVRGVLRHGIAWHCMKRRCICPAGLWLPGTELACARLPGCEVQGAHDSFATWGGLPCALAALCALPCPTLLIADAQRGR